MFMVILLQWHTLESAALRDPYNYGFPAFEADPDIIQEKQDEDEIDHHEEAESCNKWSYPSNNWPTICLNFCYGTRQSPIDIVNTETTSESEAFTYVNYNHTITTINIKNNGHSATISWDPSINIPSISGGGLGADYTLAQFHFHWGCENNRGSEHTVDSGSYAMEMHLVHYKTSYGSLQEAINYSDGLAVLGVFFLIGSENTALKPITDNLLQITETGTEADIAFNVALLNLLPSNHQTFYRYLGSLTTPTCNEVVIWSVLQFDVEMSQSQIDAFRSMKDHHNSTLCDNYREVQPLKGRNVTLYNPET